MIPLKGEITELPCRLCRINWKNTKRGIGRCSFCKRMKIIIEEINKEKLGDDNTLPRSVRSYN